jgi:cell shape-determining protein MreC
MATSPSPFDRISRNRRAPSRLWLVWALLVALLVAAAVLLRQPASSLFWRVAAPIVRVRESLGGSEAGRLRAELASTSAALADRDLLYKEVADLRERLGRGDAPQARVLASVLQRPPWTAYDTLLIDAGADHGIAAGALVSAGGQGLIGRVSEVYDTSARVELFSAPGVSYQALLNGVLPIAVEGQGGGSLRAEVPAGTQVKAGDTVAFPGLLGGIVSLVSATEDKAGESFIVIYLRLPANPADLRFVEVLRP